MIGRRTAYALGCMAVLAYAGTACAAAPKVRHHQVDVRDLTFQPDTLVVASGDTVSWTNHDIVPHTVTADGQWESAVILHGNTFTYVAGQAAAIRYRCAYHPTMIASITVR